MEDGIGVEAMIYLRRRPVHDKTAVLLSCLSRGVVLGWPMDPHHGRCLGKFLAVSAETESFGAAAVTEDNEFLISADSNGYVKVWRRSTVVERWSLTGELSLSFA